MFTAHISGWSKKELLECPSSELKTWIDEAVSLHNQMNTPIEESNNG
jgi:hypothetical protein